MSQNNRWYDSNRELCKLIDQIGTLKAREREKILLQIKEIIMKEDSELIDSHAMDFPLSFKRRWYDQDPFSWLIINCLQYANDEVLKQVVTLLVSKIPN
jgi:hypothetical protein